jgi:hypothetical protein
MKINWTTYIAANNPDGLNNVLEKYGYPAADNENEMAEAIDMLLNENGNQATVDLLKEHPDYDIIIETYKQDDIFRNGTGNEPEIKPQIQEQPAITVKNEMPQANFSVTLQNVILVVMAFWLINKIISK